MKTITLEDVDNLVHKSKHKAIRNNEMLRGIAKNLKNQIESFQMYNFENFDQPKRIGATFENLKAKVNQIKEAKLC